MNITSVFVTPEIGSILILGIILFFACFVCFVSAKETGEDFWLKLVNIFILYYAMYLVCFFHFSSSRFPVQCLIGFPLLLLSWSFLFDCNIWHFIFGDCLWLVCFCFQLLGGGSFGNLGYFFAWWVLMEVLGIVVAIIYYAYGRRKVFQCKPFKWFCSALYTVVLFGLFLF